MACPYFFFKLYERGYYAVDQQEYFCKAAPEERSVNYAERKQFCETSAYIKCPIYKKYTHSAMLGKLKV